MAPECYTVKVLTARLFLSCKPWSHVLPIVIQPSQNCTIYSFATLQPDCSQRPKNNTFEDASYAWWVLMSLVQSFTHCSADFAWDFCSEVFTYTVDHKVSNKPQWIDEWYQTDKKRWSHQHILHRSRQFQPTTVQHTANISLHRFALTFCPTSTELCPSLRLGYHDTLKEAWCGQP